MVVICATLMGAPPAEAAVAPDVPLDVPLDEEAHAEAPRASAAVADKARERRMARLLNFDIMNLRFCAVPQMLSYLQDYSNVSWMMLVWYLTGFYPANFHRSKKASRPAVSHSSMRMPIAGIRK